jgi:hypothetical protein
MQCNFKHGASSPRFVFPSQDTSFPDSHALRTILKYERIFEGRWTHFSSDKALNVGNPSDISVCRVIGAFTFGRVQENSVMTLRNLKREFSTLALRGIESSLEAKLFLSLTDMKRSGRVEIMAAPAPVAGLKVKGESLLPSPEVKPAVPGL